MRWVWAAVALAACAATSSPNPPAKLLAPPLEVASDRLISGAQGGACAIRAGRLYCWGRPFGVPPAEGPRRLERISPYSWRFTDPFRVPVPTPLRSIAISRGDYLFGCALLVGGEISCFGGRDAASDRCTQRPNMVFHAAGLPRPADAIAVEGDEACAHLDDDRLVCWGRRRTEPEQEARCAQRTVVHRGRPLRDIVRFDVGAALDRKGRVYTFGGPVGPEAIAHRVPMERAVAVASAGVVTCALFEDRRVGCFSSRWWEDRRDFGSDPRVASARGRLKVEMIYGLPSVADIRCVPHRRCLAAGEDGYLYAFGRFGGFFQGSSVARGFAARPDDFMIGVGGGCVTEDGEVRCWGTLSPPLGARIEFPRGM